MQTSSGYLPGNAAVSADSPATDNRQLIDIGRLAGTLWQRRKVIIASVGAAALLALAYVAITPSTYTAKTVLLVDPREMRLTEADDVLSGIGPDSAAITSQVEILQSRELLTPVLQQEDLFSDPEFAADGGENAVFDKFLRRLSVERQGLTYIIEVSFTSVDREKSARIANAIVAQYIQGQVSEKSRANADVTGLLEGQIDGLRRSVTEAEAAVEAFKVKNGMLDMGAGRTLLQSQVEQLNLQVLAARERARQAQNRYNQAKSLQPVPNALISNGDVLTSPTADQLRQEFNERSIELSRLANIYGQRHPRFVEEQLQIEQLKSLMAAETGRIIRRLESELALANQDIAKAEMELTALRMQSDAAAESEIELRQLQRQADASREVLEQFMRRSKETGQLDGLQRSEARVISMAVPPPRATWPRPTLTLAVAIFLGGVIGLALALLMGPATEAATTAPGSGSGNWRRQLRKPFDRSSRAVARAPIPSLGRIASRCPTPLTASGAYDRNALTAAKLEFASAPSGSFSAGLWSMIGTLIEPLPQSSGPFVFTFCAVGGESEACRLSYNTAAALERLGATVLVLDLYPLVAQPRRRSESELRQILSGAAPLDRQDLIDFPTRLPVIGVHDSNGRRDVDLDADTMERLLAKAAGKVDFIVVNGMPWKDRDLMQAVIDRSARLVVALTDAEDTKDRLEALSSEIDTEVALGHVVVETAAAAAAAPQVVAERPQAQVSNMSKAAARMARARDRRGR